MNIRTLSFSAALFSAVLTASAPVAAVANDTLDTIKARHTLVVGVRADAGPYASLVGDRNVGLEPDLARHIAQDLFGDANSVRFVSVTPGNRFAFLQNGKVDLLMASLNSTPELSKILTLSTPYARGGWTLLVRKNDPSIKSVKDLTKKQTVAVIGHTSGDAGIDRLAPNAKKVVFERVEQAHAALTSGTVDAFVEDTRILDAIAKHDPSVRVVGGKNDESGVVAACAKTNASLCAYVTKSLARLSGQRRLSSTSSTLAANTR